MSEPNTGEPTTAAALSFGAARTASAGATVGGRYYGEFGTELDNVGMAVAGGPMALGHLAA